jgi:hypothetical protein
MSITPQELELLMQEVEKEDPSISPTCRSTNRVARPDRQPSVRDGRRDGNFSEEDKHLTLLAVAAKLVLENLVLNVQLLRRHGCRSATPPRRC